MVRTDGQSLGPGRIKVLSGLLGRCTVTRLPNFLGWVDLLSYGAPHSRAWSSAIMVSQNLEYCSRKVPHFLKYPTTVISFHGQIVPSQITLINSQIAPQNSLFVPQKSQFVPHTAISGKVVGKSARDNPERYCGWVLVHCFSNKFQTMAREAMDVGLRVLKESNKSRFDSYSVRNSLLIISHIAFRDCRAHSFSDNLSRNSCMLNVRVGQGFGVYGIPGLFKSGIWYIAA